jgi:putative hemolysin
MEIGILIFALIFLTFCSGYFSASEIALFSLSSTKIKAYQSDPDPRKQLITKLVLTPHDLLVTVFMLNTLVNILIQNTASDMFGKSAGWGLKVGFPLVITLVFGEIIPKYIGLQNNISLSYYVAPSINMLQYLLKPIRKLIIDITAPISRVLFFYLRKEQDISKEELRHMLKTSQEHGVLQSDETELVWGYLNLQDAFVKELMRPREDVLYYDIAEPLTKLNYLFVDQQCSRLPVCDKSLDNVLGIITARNFFMHRHALFTGNQLIPFLSKPFYVPETTPARKLLNRFDEQKQVFAIVVNEYGTISGLITREDLVEVVIGEISDLRDVKSLYTKAGDNEIIASGRLELAEFNEIFNVNLVSENNLLTIGGWLIEHIGDIPKSGTKYETHQLLFQVLAADPNRIRRLYIRKLSDKTPQKR